jgi:uncharacterized protein
MKRAQFEFTWDKDKALANERKHGIAFLMARSVFRDPLVMITHDVAHTDDEDRWVAIGEMSNGQLVVVVHATDLTRAGRQVRIISARKPTQFERREYESGDYSVRDAPVMSAYNQESGLIDDDDGRFDFGHGIRGMYANARFPIHIDNAVLGYFHKRAPLTGISTEDAINDILRRHLGLPSQLPESAAAAQR